MTRLRLVHAIAAMLCGIAIAAVLLGGIRTALAAIIVVLFLQLWSLEVLRFRAATAARNPHRENRP